MDDLPEWVRESIKACCDVFKQQGYSNDQALLIILTIIEEVQGNSQSDVIVAPLN